MGLIHSPSIITDGLVLALDAQNSRSYPGSGTAWTDITYRGNNGTLTNGPTFEPGGPFAGSAGGSVYFDGTGDYLTTSSADNFDASSGNWTIEAWCYFTTSAINNILVTGRVSTTDRFYINWVGTTLYLGDASINTLALTNQLPLNQWFHIATVKNSTTYTIYINGSSVGSTTTALGSHTLTEFQIGARTNQNYYSNGYISNLRVIKGTALYTSNFTPPTKPLLPVTNTSLLTCQGGAIVDSSSNKFTITRTGDVRAVKTAAINLDGTNDTIDSFNASSLTDMTIEMWIYDTRSSAGDRDILTYNGNSGSYTFNGSTFRTDGDGLAARSFSGVGYPPSNQWYRFCYVKNGDLYINETRYTGSGTDRTYGIMSFGNTRGGVNNRLNGKISNIRVYNRNLTASEISYNFNAMRNRFGI